MEYQTTHARASVDRTGTYNGKGILITLVQQMESLHVKVDTLNRNMNQLQMQFNEFAQPEKPQTVTFCTNNTATDRCESLPDVNARKPSLDYLKVSRESWYNNSSVESTDSGYIQVSLPSDTEIKLPNDVGVCLPNSLDDFEDMGNENTSVKISHFEDSEDENTLLKTVYSTNKSEKSLLHLNEKGAAINDKECVMQQNDNTVSTASDGTVQYNFQNDSFTEEKGIIDNDDTKDVNFEAAETSPGGYGKGKARVRIVPVDEGETDSDEELQPKGQAETDDTFIAYTNGVQGVSQIHKTHHDHNYGVAGEPQMRKTHHDHNCDVPGVPQIHKSQNDKSNGVPGEPQIHKTPNDDSNHACVYHVHDTQFEFSPATIDRTEVSMVLTPNLSVDEAKTLDDELVGYTSTYTGKRSFSANFGNELPHPRARSPVPFAKDKKRTPYSYFKRRRTDIFEDNRPKYFDKMLEIESFSGAVDISSTVDTEEVAVKSPEHNSLKSVIGTKPFPPRNNEQIADSGLKHEQGPNDNRFVEVAYMESVQHVHDIILGNITFLRPGQHFPGVPGQTKGQGLTNGSNVFKGQESRRPKAIVRRTIQDKEISSLVQEQKQEAVDCRDPKSMHGIDTVICLDTSTSMKGEPLNQAKCFIKSFLKGLEESSSDYSLEENVALVTFGQHHQVLQHLTNNYDLFHSVLEGVQAGGPSPLWLGIAFCLTELSARGGSCTMDSLKVLPRIIIISDFMSSVKNLVEGPDIIQMDQKGNFEVSGIIEKNRGSVSSFDFVVVGSSTNQVLLDQVARGRVFTTEDVVYLSQFFRAQDALNVILTKRKDKDVDDEIIDRLMRERNMTEKSEMDVMQMLRDEGKTSKENSMEVYRESESLTIDEVEEPKFGTHVKVNPGWVGAHTRQNMLGTVIAQRKKGCLKILWEDEMQERLRYGVNGEYDVLVDDREPDYEGDELKMGTVVVRGPDWRWGNQDGGPDSIGVITSYDAQKRVVQVIWGKGGQGNYRFGYSKKYDVVRRSTVQTDKSANEKHPFWQMELSNDSWQFFAPEVNKKIESIYLSNKKTTFLVNIESGEYRVSLMSLTARNTITNINHAIRNLSLTREERLSMTNEP